ncbi:MAG: aldehyde dehydrogenase [Bacteroidaceae bacterium]|nr:aldehyde dehydrogenase [Bacteroidaceae bacterium]
MSVSEKYSTLRNRQKLFYLEHITRELPYRLTALDRLREGIKDNEQALAEALYKDLGKSQFESYATEIGILLNEIRYMQSHLRDWVADRHVFSPLALFGSRSRIHYEPRGVVLIIAPWNYPLQLAFAPLIGAIAAGNCAVIKPSSSAPYTAAVMMKIINECFEDEYIAVVEPGENVSEQLLQLQWDYIFYTGGEKHGRYVLQAAAQHLTPVTLELGGKSPCIVDSDADLRIAAKRIVWGKLVNCGQTCVAPDYLFVHREVKDKLIKLMQDEIVAQYGVNPSLSPDYPRIVSYRHFDRLQPLLSHGTIIYGGQSDREQCYIAPTLITDVPSDSPLFTDEIFGPILPIIPFDDIDDCVEHINTHPTPLALYYFTTSKKSARYMINHTESGGMCINDTIVHVANHHLPFGGKGRSGMGHYHGRYSFETFSHAKAVVSTTNRFFLSIKCAPYGNKLKWVKKILR